MTDRVILRAVDGTTAAAMFNGELGYVPGTSILYLGGSGGIPASLSNVDVTNEALARASADAAIVASLSTVATTGQYSDLLGTPTPYTLPTATTSVLGGVRIDGLTVTIASGVISTPVHLSTPATKTGTSYTVAASDTALVLNPSGTFTLTLPTPSTNAGRVLRLKLIAAQTVNSASSNVAPIASATPGTAILPNTAGAWCTLHSDGTNWITMAAG